MIPLPETIYDVILKMVTSLYENGLKAPFYVVGNLADWPEGLHVNMGHGEIIFMREARLKETDIFAFDQEGFDSRYERPSFQDLLRRNEPIQ